MFGNKFWLPDKIGITFSGFSWRSETELEQFRPEHAEPRFPVSPIFFGLVVADEFPETGQGGRHRGGQTLSGKIFEVVNVLVGATNRIYK